MVTQKGAKIESYLLDLMIIIPNAKGTGID